MSDNQKKLIKRDQDGLIEGIEYHFDGNGLISWKDMIPAEFLYVNPDLKRRDKLEKKYNKSYNDIHPIEDHVDDTDLVMTLGATKYLLRLRGYNKISSIIQSSNENYASVSCSIDFIPNFESEGRNIVYSENACAHSGNTNGFGQRYLVEMATNRSLARCVRNFLNINIVSKEELGGNIAPQEEESKTITPDPIKMLNGILSERGLSFEDLKKDYSKISEKWQSLSDIPKTKIFEIMGKLKNI
jgi:hypothetical protein